MGAGTTAFFPVIVSALLVRNLADRGWEGAQRWYVGPLPVTEASPLPSRLPHLAALDGLRGLALLGVLFFHADGALPGGYLGVDLFFVLSGYLITSLLLREHADSGRIDLYGFWVRRCRRLFPALLSLMPAVAIYGRFFARPEDLHALRSEALASLGYVANWHAIFANRSYWQLFAAPSPLEHTWSLSIEEQFYVLWPLLATLLLRRRGPRALLWLSLGLSAASMVAMLLLYAPGETSRAYLGTDTRMTAILAGAALATLLPPGSPALSSRVRQLDVLGVLAALGLALSWWKLPGTHPFLYRGGFWLTELAVLVLIACAVTGKESIVARALSLRPLTLLGTISYGVYLWHWPVHVFVTSERTHLQGLPLQASRFAITFVIAIISYRFLERPIRRHGIPFSRPHFTLPAAITLVVLMIVHATDARAGMAAGLEQASSIRDARFRVVVFGDSTANSLGWGLRGLHEDGVGVELLGKDGCTMLWDRCDSDQWAARVKELRPNATLIYLAGAYLHGFGGDDGVWHTACYADWDAKLEEQLTRRLRDLQPGPGAVYAVTLPYPLGRYDKDEFRKQIDCINGSLRKSVKAVPGVRVLELGEQLCPQGKCQTELPGKVVIRPDGVHFSLVGAADIARWTLTQIK
jgi:peptidoglycan/LPS O-acetylase OafA/YrhL